MDRRRFLAFFSAAALASRFAVAGPIRLCKKGPSIRFTEGTKTVVGLLLFTGEESDQGHSIGYLFPHYRSVEDIGLDDYYESAFKFLVRLESGRGFLKRAEYESIPGFVCSDGLDQDSPDISFSLGTVSKDELTIVNHQHFRCVLDGQINRGEKLLEQEQQGPEVDCIPPLTV